MGHLRPALRLIGLEFMGKDWDAPWKYTINDHGFSDGADRLPAPSFTSSRNPTCQKCGKRRRTWKTGPPACSCDAPEFDDQLHRVQDVQRFQVWAETWLTEVHRVLQPGGRVMSFGGTRMFHRLGAAMQNMGFEGVRLDAWNYASGFPKSLNVSKAIDKQWGSLTSGSSIVTLKKELRRLFDDSGKTRTQIDKECGFRACNYLSYPEPGKRPDPWFRVLPSADKWARIKEVLGCEGDPDLEARLDGAFAEAEREVVGFRKAVPGVAFSGEGPSEVAVTVPATPESATWDGWGTALKPAWEPILVGHKKR